MKCLGLSIGRDLVTANRGFLNLKVFREKEAVLQSSYQYPTRKNSKTNNRKSLLANNLKVNLRLFLVCQKDSGRRLRYPVALI